MAGTKKKTREKLDKIFSEYIRLKAATEDGFVTCYTCGVKKHWKQMHAGHFQTRAKYSTRFDPMNVKPQCVKCNIFNHGEQYTFALKLDEEYGKGTAERIRRASEATARTTEGYYQELIDTYQELVKRLKEKVE